MNAEAERSGLTQEMEAVKNELFDIEDAVKGVQARAASKREWEEAEAQGVEAMEVLREQRRKAGAVKGKTGSGPVAVGRPHSAERLASWDDWMERDAERVGRLMDRLLPCPPRMTPGSGAHRTWFVR